MNNGWEWQRNGRREKIIMLMKLFLIWVSIKVIERIVAIVVTAIVTVAVLLSVIRKK